LGGEYNRTYPGPTNFIHFFKEELKYCADAKLHIVCANKLRQTQLFLIRRDPLMEPIIRGFVVLRDTSDIFSLRCPDLTAAFYEKMDKDDDDQELEVGTEEKPGDRHSTEPGEEQEREADNQDNTDNNDGVQGVEGVGENDVHEEAERNSDSDIEIVYENKMFLKSPRKRFLVKYTMEKNKNKIIKD